MMGKRVFLFVICIVSFSGASSELENLKNACNTGVAEACYEMAILYEKGIGVAKDSSRALQLYSEACDNGFDKGCRALERGAEEGTK